MMRFLRKPGPVGEYIFEILFRDVIKSTTTNKPPYNGFHYPEVKTTTQFYQQSHPKSPHNPLSLKPLPTGAKCGYFSL